MSSELKNSTLEQSVLRYVNQMAILASMGHCVPTDAVHIAELVDRMMDREVNVQDSLQPAFQAKMWRISPKA